MTTIPAKTLRFTKTELAALAKDGKVVPVIGAGFSMNAKSVQLPSWSDLAQDTIETAKKERLNGEVENLANFLLYICDDPVTTISLLELEAPGCSKEAVRRLRRISQFVEQRHLPVHRSFWSTPWPVAITTNYDSFLKIAYPPLVTYGYSQRALLRTFADESERDDVGAIIHLHGLFGDRKSTPLVTWSDYLKKYHWTEEKQIQETVRFLSQNVSFKGTHTIKGHEVIAEIEVWVGKHRLKKVRTRIESDSPIGNRKKTIHSLLKRRYHRVVERIISQSQRTIRPATLKHDRIPRLIDGLLEQKHCLFIGFSFTDPIWRVIFSQLRQQDSANEHFFVNDRIPPASDRIPGITYLPLADFSNMVPWLDHLSTQVAGNVRRRGSGEKRARRNGYRYLRDTYKDASWICSGRNPDQTSFLIPFTVLWNNARRLDPKKAISAAVANKKPFLVARPLLNVREMLWGYRHKQQARNRDNPGLVNERKVRVTDWKKLPDGRLHLEVQLAEYKDFLITNHFVANGDDEFVTKLGDRKLARQLKKVFQNSQGDLDPRAVLCGTSKTIKLHSEAMCSNHLGASVMLIAQLKDRYGATTSVFICPPSRGQVSSPNDIIMAASGSVDWPLKKNAKDHGDVISPASPQINHQLKIADQIWREFGEECLDSTAIQRKTKTLPCGKAAMAKFKHGVDSCRRHIHRVQLLNLCQNIERGGKPELFYLASVKGSGRNFIENVLRFNWELDQVWSLDVVMNPDQHRTRRTMLLIPSPLGLGLRLRTDLQAIETGIRAMLQVIRDNEFNPVFRAHMASVLSYCYRVDKKRTKQAVTSILSARDLERISLEGETLKAIHDKI